MAVMAIELPVIGTRARERSRRGTGLKIWWQAGRLRIRLSLPVMAEERKTLEQRAQMTDIERLRHSAAHVLATAILRIWPEAQFAAGPPVENGFYYDVELPHRISPEDFEKIEAEMKKEIKANHPFERVELSRAD